MKWDPSDRPTARQIQEYPFLSVDDNNKGIFITEERHENEVPNLCFEGMASLDKTNKNPVSRTDCTESVSRSFKENYIENTILEGCEVEKDKYTFSSMESLEENSPLTVLDEISESIPVSSEKYASDFAPVKKVSSKKKRNFGRKIKVWITKKWHNLFNTRNH